MILSTLAAVTILTQMGRVVLGPSDCPSSDYAKHVTEERSMLQNVPEQDRAILSYEYSHYRILMYREDFVATLQGSNVRRRYILKDRRLNGLYRWLNEQPPGDSVRLEDYEEFEELPIIELIIELAGRENIFFYDNEGKFYLPKIYYGRYECKAGDRLRLEGQKVTAGDGSLILRVLNARQPR